MKANEIMIEDWVLFSGEPQRVRSIVVSDNGVERIYVFGKTCQVSTIEAYIEPIPLTAEILEKNGFIGEGDKFKLWTSADKRVILHNNDGYLNTFNKWHVHVDTEDMRTIGNIELTYVHQIQQFLRMCGLNEMADSFKI